MKKQLVVSVMVMSLALVMAGCNGVSSNKDVPDTQVTQEMVCEISYNKEVTLGVGEKLSLEMLDIKTDGDYTFDFSEKTYDSIGEYSESIPYEEGTLEVKVSVVDKTAPVIEGTHDIEITEGESVDLLNGVSSNEGEITVSDYDASLLDAPQSVVYTATDEAGNTTTKEIQLLIKSNPIESMDKTMYAQSTVNVRSGCSTENEKLGSLSTNETVHVIGQDKATSWYQIEFNGSVGYVSNDYLGDEKITVSKPSNSSGGQSSSSSSNSSSGGSSSTGGTSSSSGGNNSSSSGGALDNDFGVKSEDEVKNEIDQAIKDNYILDENGNPIPWTGHFD